MKRRKTRYAWERRSSIGCKDRVQCIPESDLCIPYSQMGAYHIVGSVHTQRASVFKPNGHQLQFSSDAHFGISIHPLPLVYLFARSNKQTNISHRGEKRGGKDDPKRQLPSLFFPEHSISARICLCCGDNFPVYHFVGSFDTAAIIREAMAIQQKPGFEDKKKLAQPFSSFCLSLPETATRQRQRET